MMKQYIEVVINVASKQTVEFVLFPSVCCWQCLISHCKELVHYLTHVTVLDTFFVLSASYYFHHSSYSEVIDALNHELDDQWREFGMHLCVKPFMHGIDKNKKLDVGACMLQLVEKWLVNDNGTGDLPRTWETVVQAVKKTGKGRLAEELAQRYLSGQ